MAWRIRPRRGRQEYCGNPCDCPRSYRLAVHGRLRRGAPYRRVLPRPGPAGRIPAVGLGDGGARVVDFDVIYGLNDCLMPSEIGSFSALLVLSSLIIPGYFLVEVILRRSYPLKWLLKEHENSIYDRTIHYVCWSVVLNAAFFMLSVWTDGGTRFGKLLEGAKGLGSLAGVFGLSTGQIQILYLSVSCTVTIMVLLTLSYISIRIGTWLGHFLPIPVRHKK